MEPEETSEPFAARELPVTLREVSRMWLPLAVSWIFMGAELPLLSAVVARLPDPEVNLAAYGGVVFPIALLIEAPIIMLLAASTALSRDEQSYRKIRTFMRQAGAALTALHVAIAFTPLYDVVARSLIGAPESIIEPARMGLKLMTPWTWAIASRRFNQGVLIRFGHSDAVGIGTAVRLSSGAAVLGLGYWLHTVPGIVVGTVAVSVAVLSEAFYAWIRVRPVVRDKVLRAQPAATPLSTPEFVRFYWPLAMTAVIWLALQPVLTAAMSRLPRAQESLAVWPALNGLTLMLRAPGMACNEVIIALFGRRGGPAACRRFTWRLMFALTALLLLLAASPLAVRWFEAVAGLRPALASMAGHAFWAAALTPALTVLASFYQGILVVHRRTHHVTEAVAAFLLIATVLLGMAVVWGQVNGLLAGQLAMAAGGLVQVSWQRFRLRQAGAF